MFSNHWRRDAPLKARLVKDRKMQSLMDKDIALANGDLVIDTDNWVRMWVDTGHAIVADDGMCVAFRGIDTSGQFMWLVRHHKKRHGYHSTCTSPHAAMAEAHTAWKERARVRARWQTVRAIARDLIMGRRKLTVTRDDAHRSALCGVGIDAFMSRMGLGRVQALSGRTAALLMRIEPQLGFAIYAAYERSLSENSATASRPAITARPRAL